MADGIKTYNVDRGSLKSLDLDRAHETSIGQSPLRRNLEPVYKRILRDAQCLFGLHEWQSDRSGQTHGEKKRFE